MYAYGFQCIVRFLERMFLSRATTRQKGTVQQECIPVGWVPPASMVILGSRGEGGLSAYGMSAQGVSAQGISAWVCIPPRPRGRHPQPRSRHPPDLEADICPAPLHVVIHTPSQCMLGYTYPLPCEQND